MGQSSDINRIPQGVSLLEVLLAMGILFGSLAVLSQLASIGIDHLNRAETSSTAVRLCQNKLGEVLAGIQPLKNVDDQPLLEDAHWNYSIEIQALEPYPMSEIRVRVAPGADFERKSNSRRGRYELIRWIYRGERDSSSVVQ